MLPIGLVLLGAAPEVVAQQHGGYSAWFRQLADRHDARLVDIDGTETCRVELEAFAGLVISGSASSLTAPEPWMDEAIDLVIRAKSQGTPVLGICFGHQLIGAAAGGTVIENPDGWEFATVRAHVTNSGARDPLFADVPAAFDCNQAHRDMIDPATLGADVAVLAENDKCATQAIAWGDSVRGLQFHPEFAGPVTSTYISYYYERLAQDAEERNAQSEHPSALPARSCPDAERTFGNFVRHFAAKA